MEARRLAAVGPVGCGPPLSLIGDGHHGKGWTSFLAFNFGRRPELGPDLGGIQGLWESSLWTEPLTPPYHGCLPLGD
jgi:hypothetical protein